MLRLGSRVTVCERDERLLPREDGDIADTITASAGGNAGTQGVNGDASGGKKDAATTGDYYKGMAVFTIVKGGALYQASVAGQKYSYKPAGS